MIRDARESDLPWIVELCRSFYKMSGFQDLAEFNPLSTEAMLRFLIQNDAGILLVAERDGKVAGAIGALYAPLPFNTAYALVQEMFWYVADEYRGGSEGLRLFAALEARAKERGAVGMSMASLAAYPGAGVFYERKGYALRESSYVKRLK